MRAGQLHQGVSANMAECGKRCEIREREKHGLEMERERDDTMREVLLRVLLPEKKKKYSLPRVITTDLLTPFVFCSRLLCTRGLV